MTNIQADNSSEAFSAGNVTPPRSISVGLAIVAGIALCAWFGNAERWRLHAMLPIVVAAALALVPPIRRAVTRMAARLRKPSRRATLGIAITLGVGSVLGIVLPHLLRGENLFPQSHDELANLVQAQILARGRLWMPPHPVGDFFDTFFLFVKPVYTPLYFPGTALLFVPAIWLGLPYIMMPTLLAALTTPLFYLVLKRVLDGWYAILGAGLLVASTMYREIAMGMMSHETMLLLGVAIILATLHWRDRPQWESAALTGALAGLAAITRPVDAVCYVLPMTWLAYAQWRRLKPRAKRGALLAAVAGGAPFIVLQLVFNMGVTGSLFDTPYAKYLRQDQPGSGFGFADAMTHSEAWPESSLVQKHLYQDQFLRPDLRAHRPDRVVDTLLHGRLPLIIANGFAHPLLAILLPVSLLAIGQDRRFRAILAVIGLILIAYTFHALLLSHYLLVWLPPLLFAVLLGVRTLALAMPMANRESFHAALALVLIGSAISAQPVFNADAMIRRPAPLLDRINQQLAALPNARAVVLFRYWPGNGFFQEPVYNADVAYPDEARIIRAHDLGPKRNIEIAQYYARTQPDRHFYLYNLETGVMSSLGRADQLFASLRERMGSRTAPATVPIVD